MKLRLLAMATVAAAALSTPALAGDGWYLGLGGGWDNQPGIRGTSVQAPTFSQKTNSNDNFIGAIAIGYKWAEGWRLENEVAFTQHDLSLGASSVAPTGASVNHSGFSVPGDTRYAHSGLRSGSRSAMVPASCGVTDRRPLAMSQ